MTTKDKDIDNAIAFALNKIGAVFNLKKEQYRAISSIVEGKDVVGVLPTGFGKSLIYQLLPDVFDYLRGSPGSIVIVVSPLNALMTDQISKLNDKGISSCMVRGQCLDLKELKEPNFQLLFVHPETCVDSDAFRKVLLSDVYQKRVVCVVVDEAHLVKEWKSFRPAYGKLDVLCGILPSIPHMALTATATKSTVADIINLLTLRSPYLIEANPNRPNIYFECIKRPNYGDEKLSSILSPLVLELKEKKLSMPLTVIYGNLATCADCYSYFESNLQSDQYYSPEASQTAQNRLFSQFHAQYPEHEKQRILDELIQGSCKSRILFVTVAFGIGIDIPNIRRIIHIGVPRTMEEYFQEAGRAGRDGLPAVATIYYNGHDIRKGKNCVENVMREFVTSTGCKRKVILDYFGFQVAEMSTCLHMCCDYHKSICECDNCLLIIAVMLENSSMNDSEIADACFNPGLELKQATTEQLDAIRTDLEDYRFSILPERNSCVSSVTFSSGFSLELIELTLEKCNFLTSVDEVMEMLPVFSRDNAEVIFDIISNHLPCGH